MQNNKPGVALIFERSVEKSFVECVDNFLLFHSYNYPASTLHIIINGIEVYNSSLRYLISGTIGANKQPFQCDVWWSGYTHEFEVESMSIFEQGVWKNV